MFMTANDRKPGTTFQTWLERWLTKNEGGWTARTVAERMEIVQSTVSHWRTGRHVPDPRQLEILSEISGEDLFYLAHLAYGWSLAPTTDPMQKDPLLREIGLQLVQLSRKAPERLEMVQEIIRGVERVSRRQAAGTGEGDK